MSADALPALNAGEVGMLDRCEAVIARGMETFVEVGEALMEIRERRLYKAYGTFEDYCRERWQMNRQRASQLITAAEVSKILDTASLPVPRTDSVARELRPVMRPDSTEQVEEVWAEVVEEHGPKPTAAQVREVVHKHVTEEQEETVTVAPEQRTDRQRQLASAQADRLDKVTHTLNGYVTGLPAIKVDMAVSAVDTEHLAFWSDSISKAIKSLRRLQADINGSEQA